MPRGAEAARFRPLSAFVVCALAGCVGGSDPGVGEGELVITGRCAVEGAGTLASGDSLEGDIHDVAGVPAGAWEHASASGMFAGTPRTLVCRLNGSRIADVTGGGTWNGVPGYSYTLHVQDRGDPSTITRVEGAPEATTLVATRTYSPSRWTDGTVAFDSGALVAVPASLPVTVGNAGNQWARLTFVDHDTGEPVRCSYRGGASRANPTSRADIARGLSYNWARCETLRAGSDCDWETDPSIVVGTVLDVDSIDLHVQHGSSRFPSCDDAQTTIAWGFEVTPFVMASAEADYYRLLVFNPADELVLFSDGDLASGNLTITQLP